MVKDKERGTRERILDAAEALFAHQGYAATSLRSITSEAGVNLAAVNYHFGSKETLMQEVLARRLRPLNRERLALLDAVEAAAGDGPPDLEGIIEAFIEPGLRLAREGGGQPVMALLGRMYAEPTGDFLRIVHDQFKEVKERFLPAMRRALPDLPDVELFWRFHFMVGTFVQAMAGASRLAVISDGKCDAHDVEGMSRRLVSFLAAALRSPEVDR